MTPPVGLSSGMDPFALDADTAERLVTGMVDAGDAPPEYRAVAQTLHALRAPECSEWAGEPAAVDQIAAAVVVHRPPTRRERRSRRSSSRVARLATAAVLVGAVCVTGAFASAGALPQPAQHAASAVLGTVGISVPNDGETPADEPPVPGTVTTPPGAPSPSQPNATAPGANAAPAAPPGAAGNGNGGTEVGGDQGHNAPPGKANGRDKSRSSNGQGDGLPPQGAENDNSGNDNKP